MLVNVLRVLLTSVGLGLPALAVAGPFPERPITLVVSFEPGGSTDVSARVVAQELGRILKQQVVVENRAGAGGRIGTQSSRACEARWLHLAVGQRQFADGRPGAVSAIRDGSRGHAGAGESRRDTAVRLRDDARGGREDARGVHRGGGPRSQPARNELRVGRQRLEQPSAGRDLHVGRRRAACAHPLQGQRPRRAKR